MNGSTAKLLRKYATISGHPYRDLKRSYNKIPWNQRHERKEMIRFLSDIELIEAPSDIEITKESVDPAPANPAANPVREPVPIPWWRGLWLWLMSFVPELR